MALVGISCADTMPQRDGSEIITVVSAVDYYHDHHGHDREWDGCSPLCVCHCCHMHFLTILGEGTLQLVKLPAVYLSYFQDINSIEISGFFKPPMP